MSLTLEKLFLHLMQSELENSRAIIVTSGKFHRSCCLTSAQLSTPWIIKFYCQYLPERFAITVLTVALLMSCRLAHFGQLCIESVFGFVVK